MGSFRLGPVAVFFKSASGAGTDGDGFVPAMAIDQTTPGTTNGVALTATEVHAGQVGGHTFHVSVEKTRPADTDAYAANDAIAESSSAGTVWTFAIGRVNAGTGLILYAEVATDDTAAVVRYEVDLYKASVTAINDNAEATRLYANQANYLGTITFPAIAKKTASSTQAEAATEVRIPFACVSATQNVIGIVRTLDADASPVSGAKVRVTLSGIQD